MKNFENIDLNLMKVFYYIYQTQSVYQAAEKLNISQSACSHSLSRLRERLDDELFIRIAGSMVPTKQAELLAESILPALDLLYLGLKSAIPFDPSIGQHHFVISGYDFSAWCLMPKLTAYLAKHFPNISVRVVQSDVQIPAKQLESGEIDVSLGFDHEAEQSSHIGNAMWLSGKYSIAMDNQHPVLKNANAMELEDFLKYPHVLVTPWNEQRGIVDATLGKLNKKRNVAITLPSVLSAPYLLKNTNYFLAVPEIYIETLAETLQLDFVVPPFHLPDYQIKIYWHKTREKEPKVDWLINLLLSLSPS
ncbi:LysR family transcriptional regulator [Vibrio sp.]|uniref:LysR family transcriptional regulator n=1 Tax=Vibrio viridaestus TaxID=2487322 RepID=A0A3N9TK33_9VIBR|nr:LysR family transcriptional regulator [Vibrio viridaestus]MDC0609810.1 LysR family transcriptional regulator [Vibrio sp.]RQW64689.1 LysR family transcriptional regulator [Vibrio viridaestus]